ncbi:ABC transporter ATP-binding protein [Daejeonella sp.]|uniref:ABC transporter ATP-binding protein n=1 Tax=Daejeonella sp. TaxID=2805397 RepID=UPI002C9D0A4C|nr:ABC transporter ATP-binding protein [Daejeonella sp.]HQT24908.1 ABC transporter ATP-binding protein [Daejeonella sp.]HQT58857.1 ABC transporter ATP-binding protein [Daejeonella sp.]
MSVAIKVEGLSKAYQLGQYSTGTLSRDIERWWAALRGKDDPFLKIGESNDRSSKGQSNIVWSLNDLNFEINQGDAVGVIGRNGAGKSTLLKLLSQVTSPTRGTIKINGRIASLLEVGTGFHPELTGRENIFLNGAILGMRKKEILRKFDEIVDFAGVERYVDTPVKRYSSGMYVRLAFAVAAHLECEILIVDEVLAVGDAEFQKKCVGKMNDLSKGKNKTILFVSHNLGLLNSLCSKSIVLSKGEKVFFGDSNEAISFYTNQLSIMDNRFVARNIKESTIKFSSVYIYNLGYISQSLFQMGESLVIGIETKNFENIEDYTIGVQIMSSDGIPVYHFFNTDSNHSLVGSKKHYITLNNLMLYPGIYYISFTISDRSTNNYDHLDQCISFEVLLNGALTSRRLPRTAGLIYITPEWKNLTF